MPGEKYLVTNGLAAAFLGSRHPVLLTNGEELPIGQRIHISAAPSNDWKHESVHRNDATFWLVRGGGFGDLLLLTPLIRELKRLHPKCSISVACGGQYAEVLQGLGVKIELLPIPVGEISKAHVIPVFYEEYIESNPRARSVHMAQHFADALSITLPDRKPSYFVKPSEQAWAREKYPRNGKKRIAVQVLASALIRSYPRIQEVVAALDKSGVEVYLFGEPGQFAIKNATWEDEDGILREEPVWKHAVNLTGHKLSFRQSAAVLETCDGAIAPDSALFHLAGAMDVPCVGLYGPFPSSLRETSPCQTAIQGEAACAPCFFHASHPGETPKDRPCTGTGSCLALSSIEPDTVLKLVSQIIR